MLCLRKMDSALWEMIQQRDPGDYSFSFSPTPPAPDSPHTSVVHCALTLVEPRVSGCKRNFWHWPFKSLSESPAVSPWQTETLQFFTAGCYLSSFYGSGAIVWGHQLGVYIPHTSEGPPWPPKYPSGTSAATHGSSASPLVPPLHSLPVLLW